MKFKKILTIMALALTVVIANVTFGQNVYAAEMSNTVASTNSTKTVSKINSDTVITENNISDVLTYLGLDSSKFIKTNVTGTSVKTVGELKNIIEQAKKSPSKIESTINKNKTKTSTGTKSLTGTHLMSDDDPVGCITVTTGVNVSGAYTLTFDASGKYIDNYWTGATGATVSVDSNTALLTYKIDSKKLRLSWDEDTITLNSDVTVGKYVGVQGLGTVEIYTQEVTGQEFFYASDYL